MPAQGHLVLIMMIKTKAPNGVKIMTLTPTQVLTPKTLIQKKRMKRLLRRLLKMRKPNGVKIMILTPTQALTPKTLKPKRNMKRL